MTERNSGSIVENEASAGEREDGRLADLERRLREAEESLRRSNGKLRMAQDIGRIGSWERDLATNEMIANATCKAFLGLAPTEPLTHDMLKKLQHPGDAERIEQAIAYALATQTDYNIEHRIVRPDGRLGRVHIRGHAIYENGKPVRLIGVIQDASERAKAREKDQHAQQRQEFLLNLNDQLRAVQDPKAIMEATSRNLGRLMDVDTVGYGEVDENLFLHVEREWSKGVISNEGRSYPLRVFPPHVVETLLEGKPSISPDVTTDPELQDPASQTFYKTVNIRTIISVPLLSDGRLIAVLYLSSSQPKAWTGDEVSLIEDVAERAWIAIERARAESGLRETEAKFRIIAESLPALVWILNPEFELTYTNERWVRFSGHSAEEALGHSWMAAIHPVDMMKLREEIEVVRRNESSYETEARYRSADGTYRWHLIQGAPIHSATGEFKGWVGTSVDIHDMKETQEALRGSEEQLRIALQAAKMGDWRWDVASDKITLSERAAEIFGFPSNVPRTWTELQQSLHPSDRARALSAMEKSVETGAPYGVEYRVTRSNDGARAWVAAQGQTIKNDDDIVTGMTGVVQDITDRKNAEERQQLLIRELHHRVKNTLATVQAIVGSTARTASSIEEFYQGFVGRIVSLARTHNILTEDFWQKASLKELIQTELGPYEDESRNRVTIEGPAVELPSEAAVPIGMAVHELTTNAAKHGALSTFGGQVEVRWSVDHSDPDKPILSFAWTERGGPRVTGPARQGFGSRLLQRVLTTQLNAEVQMEFGKDGLQFQMTMPIPGEPPLFNPDA